MRLCKCWSRRIGETGVLALAQIRRLGPVVLPAKWRKHDETSFSDSSVRASARFGGSSQPWPNAASNGDSGHVAGRTCHRIAGGRPARDPGQEMEEQELERQEVERQQAYLCGAQARRRLCARLEPQAFLALLEGYRLHLELGVLALQLVAALLERARHRVERAAEPADLVGRARPTVDVELTAPKAVGGQREPPNRARRSAARRRTVAPASASTQTHSPRSATSSARRDGAVGFRRALAHEAPARPREPLDRAVKQSARRRPSCADANARPAPTPFSRVRAITGSA